MRNEDLFDKSQEWFQQYTGDVFKRIMYNISRYLHNRGLLDWPSSFALWKSIALLGLKA